LKGFCELQHFQTSWTRSSIWCSKFGWAWRCFGRSLSLVMKSSSMNWKTITVSQNLGKIFSEGILKKRSTL